MSRIGKKPIEVPKGIEVSIKAGNLVAVKGPKGELSMRAHNEMKIKMQDAEITVERPSETKRHKALHGLTRMLIANMVQGVTEGFQRKLEIAGVGFKAEVKNGILQLALGYSHPIWFLPPDGVQIEAETPTVLFVKGIDKELVGAVASKIRSFRPVEPYKGKGIRYEGERVVRKAGKAAKTA